MISVVIPMYNAEDTILDSVDSVINQTYSERFEIIIVNDGSTDSSRTLIEKYMKDNKSNRIIKLINQENGGVSSARNRGIRESTEDWIAFLDSDDIWLKEKIEKQMQVIERNKEVKFIGTNRNNEIYPFFNKSKESLFTLTAKEIMMKWYPHTSTALVKKETLIKAGLYDEKRTHAEDGDLLVRLVLECDLYILNENLVYTGGDKRTFGELGLSANLPKMYEGELYILKQSLNRKQINILEYISLYSWLSIKYIRRKIIIKFAK